MTDELDARRAAAWEDYVADRRREQGWRADFDAIVSRAYPTWLAGWEAGVANDDTRAVVAEIATHPLPGDPRVRRRSEGGPLDLSWELLARRLVAMAQAALERE